MGPSNELLAPQAAVESLAELTCPGQEAPSSCTGTAKTGESERSVGGLASSGHRMTTLCRGLPLDFQMNELRPRPVHSGCPPGVGHSLRARVSFPLRTWAVRGRFLLGEETVAGTGAGTSAPDILATRLDLGKMRLGGAMSRSRGFSKRPVAAYVRITCKLLRGARPPCSSGAGTADEPLPYLQGQRIRRPPCHPQLGLWEPEQLGSPPVCTTAPLQTSHRALPSRSPARSDSRALVCFPPPGATCVIARRCLVTQEQKSSKAWRKLEGGSAVRRPWQDTLTGCRQ
ncbi:hypothetical protein TREES_T100001714 [Tupaia chinensis]|uniref:Uncharacterized protein n=1 Tax=Tupaia chinensis TaxID=246437 RepID=L9KJK6_TUPCH|nr:hypothetical protein TREES_T100001714 [Tupaia chinensis]